MSKKLEPCPFCGRVPKIVPCDDEGNIHLEAGYEEDPWSGLGYQIMHEVLSEDAADDCPIATFKGETMGTNIYDTRDEAAAAWNRRASGLTPDDLPRAAELLRAESPYPDGDTSILSCPHCGSGEYLSNEDGAQNAFCGQCGERIDWSAVAEVAQGDDGDGDCIYKTYDGYCIKHGDGVGHREPCLEGPCDDETPAGVFAGRAGPRSPD